VIPKKSKVFYAVLNGLNLLIPDGITESFTFVFGTAKYLIPIFPIADLMICVVFVLTAWSLIYTFKIVMWIIGYIPWIGHRDLPGAMDHSDKQHASQREYKGTIRQPGKY